MIEAIDPVDKRAALRDVVETQIAALGETFKVEEFVTPTLLNVRSIPDNLLTLENNNGVIRSLNIYWLGSDGNTSAPNGSAGGLLTQGNRQYGTNDEYRLTIHWEFDASAPQASYDAFALFLQGTNPDGLIRFLNKTSGIETDDGRVMLVSTVSNIIIPPVPRSHQNDRQSGKASHFAQFELTLTDA